MSGTEWNMAEPFHFTVGAVGEPGAREFFFQAVDNEAQVEVKCEKQQAAALADQLTRLLADLPEPADAGSAETAPVEALESTGSMFVVGSISIGVDRTTNKIVVLFDELVLDPDDELEPIDHDPMRLMVHLSHEQVLGFAAEAIRLSAAGRPICRLCSQPIDPQGHACPRLN